MVKTTPLDEETHEKLKDIQMILLDKYSIKISIQDIISKLIPNPDEAVRKIIV